MVWAPREVASFSAATVKGVVRSRRRRSPRRWGRRWLLRIPRDAVLDGILGVLDRLHDGACAAGDQVNHLSSGQLKVGGSSAPSWTPMRPEVPAPDIDEPPAVAQALDRIFRGGGDGGEGEADRGHRRELALEKAERMSRLGQVSRSW